MPKPKKGESERDFLSRCIPMLIHEGKEQNQSIAICYSVYRKEGDNPSPKPEPKSNNSSKKNLSRSGKIKLLYNHY